MSSPNIRNICIIAHVDHGKTTLVDHLLRQAGTYKSHEVMTERVMDSDDQEKERGITISAKNASFKIGDTKVNVVDTPGHADFGGEVERIMGMVDGAILLVDAAEGPLPQTRFVLEKAIQKNLKIILCINKVDRPEVQDTDMISKVIDKTFELFVELNASDEQCDFPIIYACAKLGWCTTDADRVDALVKGTDKGNFADIYDLIMNLPAPKVMESDKFTLLVTNVAYSDYVGYLAVGRVVSGTVKQNDTLFRYTVDAQGKEIKEKFLAQKLFVFDGLRQKPCESIEMGDIGLIAGGSEYMIGDTVGSEGCEVLPRISVEEPTMRMIFSVNTSPNSGTNGKAIQSRELRDRLIREIRNNVALKMDPTDEQDQFYLLGRGELQFSIIIEKLRREGLEFMVGRPSVVYKKGENGERLEPYEKLTIDVPEVSAGDVTNMFQLRKGFLTSYEQQNNASSDPRVRITIEIPTRGILGMQSRFKTITKGSGIMSSEAIGYRPHQGEILHRITGSIIADRLGKTTAYALAGIQDRGMLFIGEAVDVYEGMVIGEGNKDNDINVNVCRPKKLTNVRSVSSDGITILHGLKKMSLEQYIEWIDADEWIEVTPNVIRVRKKILPANQRSVRRQDRDD